MNPNQALQSSRSGKILDVNLANLYVQEPLVCSHFLGTNASQSADFWFMAYGVREFFKDQGVMPLSGTLPDMKAQSSDYIELQNIYKSKAIEDVNLVTSHIRRLEQTWPSRKPISVRDIT